MSSNLAKVVQAVSKIRLGAVNQNQFSHLPPLYPYSAVSFKSNFSFYFLKLH
jgi:hypothetical protein